jgi:hypothetical protein
VPASTTNPPAGIHVGAPHCDRLRAHPMLGRPLPNDLRDALKAIHTHPNAH